MNKKLLISLLSVVVVAGVAFGATRAFFSDTEVSAGNVFTAGAIDLKVDHTKQVYNNVDCKTCNMTLVSDASEKVVEENGTAVATPFNAKLVTPTSITNTYWTANLGTAKWVWAYDPISNTEAVSGATYVFERKFDYYGPIVDATLELGVGVDNSYEVYLNGNTIGSDANEQNFVTPDSYTVTGQLVSGSNTLRFKVRNWPLQNGNPQTNPGGLLYKLTINGDCDSDWFQQYCRLWQSKDLVSGTDIFYNFDDIKPADWGVNVISLNVTSNDAYACLLPKITSSIDNGINDPESELDEDYNSSDPTAEGEGEIEDQTYFFAWLDADSDGVYEPGDSETPGESALTELGPVLASTFLTTPLDIFTPDTDSILPTDETQYLGIAWCAGTMTVTPTGVFGCDGSGMNNAAQTDRLITELGFYVEQVRNNEQFVCPGSLEDEEIPE